GRIGCDVEQRCRVGRGGGYHNRVAHRVGFLERPDDLRDRRLLLADRVVDADDAGLFLIDDRVDRDGGLASLAVADDQLALAATDRHHRVNRLQTGLNRLLDRLSIDDAGRQPLNRRRLLGDNRTLSVDRLTERVDDATQQLVADGHRDDTTRPLDWIAFLDFLELAQQHGADALLFEVERDAEHAMRELEHLTRHGVLDAVHARDAVAYRDD